MRLIKPYGFLKNELIESVTRRKDGNDLIINATLKYLPQNQNDLESLKNYSELLEKTIEFIKNN